MMRNKYAISMLEILLVITLIILIGGAVALPTQRFLKDTNYQQGVKRLTQSLELAQELCLMGPTDLTLKFKKQPSGKWTLSLSSDKKLTSFPPNWLARQTGFSGIANLTWEPESQEDQEENEFELFFEKEGRKMPRGALKITSQTSPVKIEYLLLPGYIAPIRISNIPFEQEETDPLPLYPEHLDETIP